MRRTDLAACFIALVAFGLRLYALDQQDIWGDEAFSIWLSSQPLPHVIAGGADTHPPLYPFLLFLWLRFAGSQPFAVRFLSAFFGTLITPLAYVLGVRAFRRTTGRLAALLTAVSPVLIYYSQETRMYGLVTLLTAASVYWTIRLLREAGSARLWGAYSLTTLAAAYTHYYAFLVLLAENLIVLGSVRHRWRALTTWLSVQSGLIVAYLPWIAVQSHFLSGKASARFEEWSLSTILDITTQTFSAFSGGLAVADTPLRIITVLFLIVLVSGLVVALFHRRAEAWLIVAYLLLPLFLAWAINPILPFFYARYLLLIAPAFYLLAALGVTAWARLWQPLGAAGLVSLLVGSGWGLWGYYTDETYVKGRYGQMMAYIESHARPGDGLILANPLQRPLFEYYQPEGLKAYFFPLYEWPLEDPHTFQELEAIAARHPRVWLVRFGNPTEYDPDGYLVRWLATHGSKAYFGGWADADLSLYVMASASVSDTIPHPLQVDLGKQIRLLGYDLQTDQVAPGDVLLLTLYWQALAPIGERYTVFTHLLDATEQIQGQLDSEPQGGGLPTNRWTVGQIIQDNYALVVSQDAVPGLHFLEVGMYRLETLERLPVSDPNTGALLGDRIMLGTVEVVAP